MRSEFPTINIAAWTNGSPEQKRKAADALASACETTGLFYLTGHGVNPEVIRRAFAAARNFFALPPAVKAQVHYAGSGRNWGYLPGKAEASDPTAGADLKEAFDIGLQLSDPTSTSIAARVASPNLWPLQPPGFREDVEACFSTFLEISRTLFAMLALALSKTDGHFESLIGNPIASMRLLRYPSREGGELGIGEHCDYECFTILAQEGVGGLQARTRQGEWADIAPQPGALIVNVGEMLAYWSDGSFRAAPHRVINPERQDRYSAAFFFAPNPAAPIVPGFRDVCEGAKPILAGDYLATRLREIYDLES